MPRDDRLLIGLTLLGLVGAGLVATIHDTEDFDPRAGREQVGRRVEARLVVIDARAGDDWASGTAIPATDGVRIVRWVWFRATATPSPGDTLSGLALVQQDTDAPSLVFDGRGARLAAQSRPVPVRWDDLISGPERYEGLVIAVRGIVTAHAVLAPDGAPGCARPPAGRDGPDTPAPAPDAARATAGAPAWIALRVTRTPDAPGWWCRPEDPQPWPTS